MFRRLVSSLVGIVAVATSVAAQAPTGTRQGPEQAAGPRPYAEVITAAVTDTGLFTVHRIDEKLFYEIPRGMLSRDMLMVADQRGTIRGAGYGGQEITNRIVRWERRATGSCSASCPTPCELTPPRPWLVPLSCPMSRRS